MHIHRYCYHQFGQEIAFKQVVPEQCYLVAYPDMEGVWVKATVETKLDNSWLCELPTGKYQIRHSFFLEYKPQFDEWIWRSQLQPGSFIMACDKDKKWHKATVLALKTVQKNVTVKIGLRRYKSTGDKSDSQGSFKGLGSQHDIQLDILSRSIQRPGLISVQLSSSEANNQLPDIVSRPLLTNHNVLSHHLTVMRGNLYIKSGNLLIEKGGLHVLQFLIRDQDPNYQNIFYNISIILKYFVHSIHHQHLQPFNSYLIKLLDFILLNKIKLINYQILDFFFRLVVVHGLKRQPFLKNRNQQIFELHLKMISSLVKEVALQKQVYAIKLLSEVVQNFCLKKKRAIRLKQFLAQTSLLFQMYNNQTHIQIFQRSQPFFTFLGEQKIIKKEQMSSLLDSIFKTDQHTRQCAITILTKVSKDFQADILQAIADKLISLQHDKLTQLHLELAEQVAQYTFRSRNFVFRVSKFLIKVSTLFQLKSMRDKAVSVLMNLFKLLSWDQRLQIVQACLQSLNVSAKVGNEIKILDRVFKQLKDSKDDSKKMQNYLNQKGLQALLFKFIKEKDQALKDILQFLTQFSLRTGQGLSHLFQQVFSVSGPSQVVISWVAQQDRDFKFTINQLFKLEMAQSYKQFSSGGMKALITLFIDVNKSQRKLVQILIKKQGSIVYGPQSKSAKVGTSTAKKAKQLRFFVTFSPVEQMFGIDMILQLFLLTNKKNQSNFASFLTKLFLGNNPANSSISQLNLSFLAVKVFNNFLPKIVQNPDSQIQKLQIQKLFKLVQGVIEGTQQSQQVTQQPFRSLFNQNICKIKVVNQINFKASETVLLVSSNITVLELRKKIAQHFKIAVESFEMFQINSVITKLSNGKSLYEQFALFQSTVTIKKKGFSSEEQFQQYSQNKINLSRTQFERWVINNKLQTQVIEALLGCEPFVSKSFFLTLLDAIEQENKSIYFGNYKFRELLDRLDYQALLLQIANKIAKSSRHKVYNFLSILPPSGKLKAEIQKNPNIIFECLDDFGCLYRLMILLQQIENSSECALMLDYSRLLLLFREKVNQKYQDRIYEQMYFIQKFINFMGNLFTVTCLHQDNYSTKRMTQDSKSQPNALKAYFNLKFRVFQESEEAKRLLFQKINLKQLAEICFDTMALNSSSKRQLMLEGTLKNLVNLLVICVKVKGIGLLTQGRELIMRLITCENQCIRQNVQWIIKQFLEMNEVQTLVVQMMPEGQSITTNQYYQLLHEVLKSKQLNQEVTIQLLNNFILKVVGYNKKTKQHKEIGFWLTQIKQLLSLVGHHLPVDTIQVLFNSLLWSHLFTQINGLQAMVAEGRSMVIQQFSVLKKAEYRKIAFQILVKCTKYHQELQNSLLNFLMHGLNQYFRPDIKRRPNKKNHFVGLRNLGCICYINALLQCFFHISQFKQFILSFKSQENQPKIQQIRRMGYYLQLSQRSDYNPQLFLKAFQPPINPSFQQDTSEFLIYLFDSIQKEFKSTPGVNILQQLFGGTTVTQMICQGCQAIRSITQRFFSYGIPIKNKKNLQEAVQGAQKGQMISDCFCENCNQKNDTLRRTLLDKLPKYFLISLQRIIFDMDTFRNVKIHSKVQFPKKLNFKPFILDQSNTQNLDYQLKSVIVHSGSAQQGHYYTYVQNQKDWIKLDDSKVSSQFQMMMQEECYGGKVIQSQWGILGEQSANAYVLLYEQISQQKKQQRQIEMDQQLVREVQRDNLQFFYQYYLYGKANQHIFDILLDTYELSDQKELFDLNLKEILFSVLTKLDNLPLCRRYTSFLVKKTQNSQNSNSFYFVRNSVKCLDLYVNFDQNVRMILADLLIAQFAWILTKDPQRANNVIQFLNHLHSYISKQGGINSRGDAILKTWAGLSTFVPFKEFASSKNLVIFVIHYYLGKNSPLDMPKIPDSDKFAIDWTPIQTIVDNVATNPSQDLLLLLRSMALYNKLFKDKVAGVSYLANKFMRSSQSIKSLTLQVVKNIGNTILLQDIKCYLDIARVLLLIEDQAWITRVEWILGTPIVNNSITGNLFNSDSFHYVSSIGLKGNGCVLGLIQSYRENYACITLQLIDWVLNLAQLSPIIKMHLLASPNMKFNETSLLSWVQNFALRQVSKMNDLKIQYKDLDHNKVLFNIQQFFLNNKPIDVPLVYGKLISFIQEPTVRYQDLDIEVLGYKLYMTEQLDKIKGLHQTDLSRFQQSSPVFTIFSDSYFKSQGLKQQFELKVEQCIGVYELKFRSKLNVPAKLFINNRLMDYVIFPFLIECELGSYGSFQVKLAFKNPKSHMFKLTDILQHKFEYEQSQVVARVQSQKVEQKKSESSKGDVWECKSCTLLNSNQNVICEVCYNAKE